MCTDASTHPQLNSHPTPEGKSISLNADKIIIIITNVVIFQSKQHLIQN